MTKKEYEKIDYEIEQAQIHFEDAIDSLEHLGLSKSLSDAFSDLSDSIRWRRDDLSKEQRE